MEIIRLSDTSIKIKTKKATLSVDPHTKTDAEIVLLTTPRGEYVIPEDAKLVIDGPGEYEVSGVSIKAERAGQELTFSIYDDQYRIVLVHSSGVAKIKDDGGYDAVVIRADGPVDDTILSIAAADTILLYGNESEMNLNNQEIKKMPRVNLKKKEEVKGFAIYLGF